MKYAPRIVGCCVYALFWILLIGLWASGGHA